MGKYINEDSKGNALPVIGKVAALIADGAKLVEENCFQPGLVCVVENGFFDAAGYCFSESEYKAFNQPTDYRPKTWLVYEHAEKLAQ